MTQYERKQKRKMLVIPLVASGRLSIRKAAKTLNMSVQGVFMLKHRYLKIGNNAFIRQCAHVAYNRKITKEAEKVIINLYNNFYSGENFSAFQKNLLLAENINLSYAAVLRIFQRNKIKSPKTYKRNTKTFDIRPERMAEGELVQMDASKHQWFMTPEYFTLSGAVDDSTHKILALYMTKNECRQGYNGVLKEMFKKDGVPLNFYVDRHSSFVRNPRKDFGTESERLFYSHNEKTHFIDICNKLNINVILALSPQAKGRIERLWETLQGQLPFLFRRLGIRTPHSANIYLRDVFIPFYNSLYAIPSQNHANCFRQTRLDLSELLAVKIPRYCDKEGYFTLYDDYFFVPSLAGSYRKKITVYISDDFGVKAKYKDKFYEVEYTDNFSTTQSSGLPAEVQRIVSDFLCSDLRQESN